LWRNRHIGAGNFRCVHITNKDEIINQVEKRLEVTPEIQDTRRKNAGINFDTTVKNARFKKLPSVQNCHRDGPQIQSKAFASTDCCFVRPCAAGIRAGYAGRGNGPTVRISGLT
jgi:hypothetical protein